jgi:hypothetical protein
LASFSIPTQATETEPPISNRPIPAPRALEAVAKIRLPTPLHAGTGGEQAMRAPGVDQDPGGDLHGDVTVKIESRQVAQGGGANAEIVHQLGGHNGRCHALVKSKQIQEGTQPPDRP